MRWAADRRRRARPHSSLAPMSEHALEASRSKTRRCKRTGKCGAEHSRRAVASCGSLAIPLVEGGRSRRCRHCLNLSLTIICITLKNKERLARSTSSGTGSSEAPSPTVFPKSLARQEMAASRPQLRMESAHYRTVIAARVADTDTKLAPARCSTASPGSPPGRETAAASPRAWTFCAL